MHGPSHAIFWQLWRRHRWGLSADLAYLAAAPAIVGLIPSDAVRTPVAGVLGLVGVGVLTHLVGVFSYGYEADLAKKESGYPPRAFVLPASNWTLTAWPMIGGAAVSVTAWLVVAVGVLRPGGCEIPLWWPGAGLAALLGMSQAIGWTPFSHHWLRLVLAFPIGGILAGTGAIAVGFFDANEWLLLGCFSAVWAFFVPAAYAGVERARRGEPVSWRWLDRVGSRSTTSNRAARGAFRSPLRAQLWFEMRRNGWTMPLLLGSILLCFTPALLMPNGLAMPAWRILAIVAGLPPMMAGLVAMGFGKPDPLQRGTVMPQFMATRPVSCARLVGAKMLAAALTVLISCGMVLAVILLSFLRSGNDRLDAPWSDYEYRHVLPGFLRSDSQQSLPALWQDASTWKVASVVILAIAFWIVFSWRQLAGSLWVALTGREWVGNANAFTFSSLLLSALLLGFWLFYHPEHLERVPALVPWCLAAMLTAKIAVGSWCARQLVVRRLMSRQTLGLLFAIWCAAVAFSCGVIAWLTPRDLWAAVSLGQVICGLVLMIPFARLAGAPLALSFNRHR